MASGSVDQRAERTPGPSATGSGPRWTDPWDPAPQPQPWLGAWAPWSVLIGALMFVIVCATSAKLWLADTYMSLYAGRWVNQHGIPGTDPFTIAGHGLRWVDQQWLAQLIYYRAWLIGGATAVGALSALLIAGSFGMLAAIMLRRGIDPLRTAMWTAIACFVCHTNTLIRAQSFAYVTYAAVLWVIFSDEQQPRFRRRTWLAVPVLIVWANTHGSALMGAVIVFGWTAYRAVLMARRGDRTSAGAYAALAVVALASVAVVPYTPAELFDYYRSVMSNPAIAQYVTEWAVTSFSVVSMIFIFMLVIVLIVAGVAIGRGYRPATAPAALTLITGLAATQALRYQMWFAFPAALFVAETLQHVTAAGRDRRRAGTSRLPAMVGVILLLIGAGLSFAPPKAVRAEALCIIAGLILAGEALTRITPGERNRWLTRGIPAASAVAVVLGVAAIAVTPRSQLEKYTPFRAIAVAHRYAVAHPNARILADDASSPALLWYYPDLDGRIGFDARLEIFPQSTLLAYMHYVSQDAADWSRATRGYDVLVASRNLPSRESSSLADADTHLRGWRTLESDPGGVVVVRR